MLLLFAGGSYLKFQSETTVTIGLEADLTLDVPTVVPPSGVVFIRRQSPVWAAPTLDSRGNPE